MIYLGASWPDEYRGSLFMNNIHGARINRDMLTSRAARDSSARTRRTSCWPTIAGRRSSTSSTAPTAAST